MSSLTKEEQDMMEPIPNLFRYKDLQYLTFFQTGENVCAMIEVKSLTKTFTYQTDSGKFPEVIGYVDEYLKKIDNIK